MELRHYDRRPGRRNHFGKAQKKPNDDNVDDDRGQTHRDEVARRDGCPPGKQQELRRRWSGNVYGRHAFDDIKDVFGIKEVATGTYHTVIKAWREFPRRNVFRRFQESWQPRLRVLQF